MATKKSAQKGVRIGKHQRSIEQLSHFRCKRCNKWWSVGDAPKSKKTWWCTWCGCKAPTP